MKHLLLLLTLLLIAPALTTAQDDTGWPVIKRCVGEPTAPPNGWTFEGTILLGGHYGVHAVSKNFNTPYVVAFIDYGRAVPGGAGLSPDGKWYAVLEGQEEELVYTSAPLVKVGGIRVYSMVTPHESYSMAWESAYSPGRQGLWHEMYWLDTTHLIYESSNKRRVFQINPFNQTFVEWDEKVYPTLIHDYPAPDWTRSVIDTTSEPGEVWALWDGETTKPLENLIFSIYWFSDSSHFVAVIEQDAQRQLTLFDRDGNLIDNIFDLSLSEGVGFIYDYDWNANKNLLAFTVGTSQANLNVYLADLSNHEVISLCTRAETLAWSPDGDYLALEFSGLNADPIQILDLAAMRIYTVAYHRGNVIGWRAD